MEALGVGPDGPQPLYPAGSPWNVFAAGSVPWKRFASGAVAADATAGTARMTPVAAVMTLNLNLVSIVLSFRTLGASVTARNSRRR